MASNAPSRTAPVESAPGLELDLERLGDRLDDEVAVREVLVLGGPVDPLAGGAGLVVAEPTARDGAVELVLDDLEPTSQGAGVDLASTTSKPDCALTWAMPPPICPAPSTPTREMVPGSPMERRA